MLVDTGKNKLTMSPLLSSIFVYLNDLFFSVSVSHFLYCSRFLEYFIFIGAKQNQFLKNLKISLCFYINCDFQGPKN